MPGYRISDPFFRQLYSRLEEDLQARKEILSNGGSTIRGASGMLVDVANTALRYSESVAYIQALQKVIDLGIEIDQQIYGTASSQNDGDN